MDRHIRTDTDGQLTSGGAGRCILLIFRELPRSREPFDQDDDVCSPKA